MEFLKQKIVCVLIFLPLLLSDCSNEKTKGKITLWFGDTQHVGKSGIAQNDFNLLGHIEPWREIDMFTWMLNNKKRNPPPISFRAYRRLVENGDFNIDIPIGKLKKGENQITLTARLLDGDTISHQVRIFRHNGPSKLPYSIKWGSVDNIQDVGQVVDGNWGIYPDGLKTKQVGYDRIFLIGEKDWENYEVLTTVKVYDALTYSERGSATGGGAAVGILFYFTGHVSGGPSHFPSGQPKWGYQPFGGITWLQWDKEDSKIPPTSKFYPGFGNIQTEYGQLKNFKMNVPYQIRSRCQTIPDGNKENTTIFSFKVWRKGTEEPADWDWHHTQKSEYALNKGGIALIAHHVDVTFGDVEIKSISD